MLKKVQIYTSGAKFDNGGTFQTAPTTPEVCKFARMRRPTSDLAQEKLREVKLQKVLERPMPALSAHSWVVYSPTSKQIVIGRCEREKREIASLTKIMTVFTCLRLVDRGVMGLGDRVSVQEEVAWVQWTTAGLLPGDTLSV